MSQPFKYRAFISYSHSDERWARWLHRALETYRVPHHLVGRETEFGPVPERLAPVFRDREELATATNLGETLTRALRESAAQIVICSPAAARSRWVNEEILTFKRLGREDRIFCLIVSGEPGASTKPATAADECFPNALTRHVDADGALMSLTDPLGHASRVTYDKTARIVRVTDAAGTGSRPGASGRQSGGGPKGQRSRAGGSREGVGARDADRFEIRVTFNLTLACYIVGRQS